MVLLIMGVLQAVAGEAGLDVIAFETVPCLKELRAISRLMRTEFPGSPAWVSCSCRDAGHIAHGESLAGRFPLCCSRPSSPAANGEFQHGI